jgi:hypothetical protein
MKALKRLSITKTVDTKVRYKEMREILKYKLFLTSIIMIMKILAIERKANPNITMFFLPLILNFLAIKGENSKYVTKYTLYIHKS